jgi:non-ribosomal peptide synthetase component F
MRQVMPVGVGMKDVDLLLLNSAGQQAGIGEAAEIYVRSPHLARGYVGLPEETALKFIANPFSPSHST